MAQLTLYATTKRKHLYLLNEDVDRIMTEEVGPRYLEYRKMWEKATRLETEGILPVQLDMELSTRCNYLCPFCTEGVSEGPREVNVMEFPLFTKMIDEACSNGVYSLSLNYVNEPLMCPDIARYIAYARQKGMLDIMFNSNGSLLTEKRAKDIILSGLTKLSISLDAVTPDVYKIMRKGGNYERVIGNIQKFLEIRKSLNQRLPLLKVTFLVTKQNRHQLEDFVSYWQGKADLLSIQNFTNPFNGEDRQKAEELLSVQGVQLNPDPDYRCPQPYQRMLVRHDGKVLACCHFRGSDLVLGDANRQSLVEIYQGMFARKLRHVHKEKKYSEIPACDACIKNSRLENY